MADLENTINPTIDNTENANSDIVQINDLNTNLEESNQPPQEDSNVLGNISNDTTNDTITYTETSFEQPVEISTDLNNIPQGISEPYPTQESPQVNTFEENQTTSENQPYENLNSIPESEPTNNEVILGRFDNTTISTPEETQNSLQLNNTIPENSINEENSTIEEPNIEDQQKSKSTQKEKLLQLIKAHESKAQKSGFTKGILSGIVAAIGIITLAGFFAKDQIANLLNDNNSPSLNASVVDLTENNNEDINPENILEDEYVEDNEVLLENIEEFNDSEYNEDINQIEYEENLNEITEYSEEVNLPENNESIDTTEYNENESEEINNEENNENINEITEYNEEVDLPENNESIDTPESDEISNEEPRENSNGYTINHVDSVEEANWVLPANCYDLTCYGEDKGFTPCSTFKPVANIKENVNRIGNNGICIYKDASELVYVDFK